jgi:Ribbon-helix-helix protein, copG family
MKRVTVDLEEEQFEQLRKAAFDRHQPMAVIIRDALHKHLDEAGRDNTSPATPASSSAASSQTP